MAQTPCLRATEGHKVKYTPGADVIAGQVVVVGTRVMIAPEAIASGVESVLEDDGGWDVPASTEEWSQGDELFWNSTGDPVGGTAGSGCFTNVGAGNTFAGYAAKAKAATLGKGKLNLTPARSRRLATKTVAAAGTVQGDAAQLIEGFNLVTGADDAKGVILPAAVAGMQVIIKVGDGADLKVWPAVGDAINAIAANSAMTVVDDVCFMLTALNATTWYTTPLLPS